MAARQRIARAGHQLVPAFDQRYPDPAALVAAWHQLCLFFLAFDFCHCPLVLGGPHRGFGVVFIYFLFLALPVYIVRQASDPGAGVFFVVFVFCSLRQGDIFLLPGRHSNGGFCFFFDGIGVIFTVYLGGFSIHNSP